MRGRGERDTLPRMPKKSAAVVQGIGLLVIGGLVGYWGGQAGSRAALARPPVLPASVTSVQRGAQLVALGGCDDCHTPLDAQGKPDMNRRLSGYPADATLPPAVDGTMTMVNAAFRGSWGLSEARNLTPDPDTGIGRWTLADFIKTMRTGVDPAGHALLPPMPVDNLRSLPDADLEAMYNYLRTVSPVRNAVTGP